VGEKNSTARTTAFPATALAHLVVMGAGAQQGIALEWVLDEPEVLEVGEDVGDVVGVELETGPGLLRPGQETFGRGLPVEPQGE